MKLKVNFIHPLTGNNTIGTVEATDFNNSRKSVLKVHTSNGYVNVLKSKITNHWENTDV